MASLRVKDQGNGPVIYGRWRDGTQPIERVVGRGWLVEVGKPGAKPNGKQIGRWREKRGRPSEGYLSVQAAIQRLSEVQQQWREEKKRQETRAKRQKRDGVTLRQAAEEFLGWGSTADPHSEREGWKHSYAQNMKSYVERIARELGEDRRIDSFTEDDLRTFMAGLVPTRNGKPTGAAPSRKFLSNYSLPLKGLFAYATDRGWIETNPADALPSYKPKRKRAADPLRREEYLKPEEVRAVVGELEQEQDRAIILVMAMAGLRPGEAEALRWQDIDLDSAVIRVVESRTMRVTGTPKSGSGRSVPMPHEVAQALARVGLRKHLTEPRDLVFVGQNAGHVDRDALRRRFEAAQTKAGIAPVRELRQLRNTFGTVMAAAGVPLRTIQEWMGHENISTTERYASFLPRHEDAAKVSAAFRVGTDAEIEPAHVED